MKGLLLAGCALLMLTGYSRADELPASILGNWSLPSNPNEEAFTRYTEDDNGGDLIIEKDKMFGVDTDCVILGVKKLAETRYTVQTRCEMSEGSTDRSPTISTDEFELLKSGKLLISPTGS